MEEGSFSESDDNETVRGGGSGHPVSGHRVRTSSASDLVPGRKGGGHRGAAAAGGGRRRKAASDSEGPTMGIAGSQMYGGLVGDMPIDLNAGMYDFDTGNIPWAPVGMALHDPYLSGRGGMLMSHQQRMDMQMMAHRRR